MANDSADSTLPQRSRGLCANCSSIVLWLVWKFFHYIMCSFLLILQNYRRVLILCFRVFSSVCKCLHVFNSCSCIGIFFLQLLDHNVQQIVDYGFTVEQAEHSLRQNRNNVERALRALQVMIFLYTWMDSIIVIMPMGNFSSWRVWHSK
jgi:hypothetical protein